MNVRAPFAALALLLLGGCGVLASHSDDGVAIARADPAPPLVGRKWPDAQIARVRSVLDAALSSPYFKSGGIAIADSSGRVIYQRNATHAFAPASTFKTLVAATALATLGSDTRFSTRLVSLEQPDAAGNIDDLWLIGSGDPVLDPDQMRDGIGALYRAGVRRVDGDVVVDPTAFKTPEQNKGWAPDDFEYDYAAGTSVISLNWNVIQFKVTPTQLGAPPRVTIVPANPDITIRNSARTGYRTDLVVQRIAPGRNEFTMTGTVGSGQQIFFRPVDGIPLWA
ncbi:MAG: D-alanyl-D-alanine carboxypeptidase, partial [Vulcanimicrobiaceae bacterium]